MDSLADGAVVRAFGEFDLAAVSDVHGTIDQAATESARPGRVVIDLSAVTFLDATMLGALVIERRALQGVGGDLVLTGVTTWSLRIIEICGLRGALGL